MFFKYGKVWKNLYIYIFQERKKASLLITTSYHPPPRQLLTPHTLFLTSYTSLLTRYSSLLFCTPYFSLLPPFFLRTPPYSRYKILTSPRTKIDCKKMELSCILLKLRFGYRYPKVSSIISKGLIKLKNFVHILNLNAARPYPCENKSVFQYSVVVFVDGAGAGREQSLPARCRGLPLWLRSRDKRMTNSLCYIFLDLGFRSRDIHQLPLTYIPGASPGEVTTCDVERRRRDNRVSNRKWCESGANIPLFTYIKSCFIFILIHNSMVKMTTTQNNEIHFIYV